MAAAPTTKPQMKTPSIDLSFVEWVRRGRHHTGPAAGASVTDGRLEPRTNGESLDML
jgi:hypothetical protein